MSGPRLPRERLAIPCASPGCRHAAAYVLVVDGQLTLLLHNRHNGVRHTTLLTIRDVLATVETTADAPPVMPTP